jgi:hypothetical protein
MADARRWTHMQQIFHQARALPENEREAWLDARCAGDAALLAEVASLMVLEGTLGVSDSNSDGVLPHAWIVLIT